ncbi:YwgA family protein [Shouchella sp. 1P09AA]|uniref:YwgA family protein n=1 Tax=unclassified Shouchella TaxID=2893065 RepID=UPI00399F6255
MLSNHVQVLKLFSLCEKTIEHKKLQKIIYIAKSFGAPFAEKYRYHRLGPYSEDLFVRLEELCNLQFLKEERDERDIVYMLTNQGETFLHKLLVREELDEFTDVYKDLNSQPLSILEQMAALLYFQKQMESEGVRDPQLNSRYSNQEWLHAETHLMMLRERQVSYEGS